MKKLIKNTAWESMRNKAMQRKLEKGEAIDLSENERDESGNYIITNFVDGVDYCDAKAEAWIWSIGEHKETGRVLASVDGRFYQNAAYKCIWLR